MNDRTNQACADALQHMNRRENRGGGRAPRDDAGPNLAWKRPTVRSIAVGLNTDSSPHIQNAIKFENTGYPIMMS